MKIALLSVGTRGDVEPFLAVAELLRAEGHEVTIAIPAQYGYLAGELEMECVPLDRRFLELLEGTTGRAFLGGRGSIVRRIRLLYKLARAGFAVNRQLVAEQIALLENGTFDRVVFHPKASFPFVWSVRHPGRAIVLSPVPWVIHPVPGHAQLGFGFLRPIVPARLTYRLANFGLLRALLSPTRAYRERNGIRKADVRESILGTKTVYNTSPALLPPPPDWPDHVRVLGFNRRREQQRPLSAEVQDFLARHEKFIFLTFGSMVNAEPLRYTEIFLRALAERHIPAIINTAAGGLVEPPAYDRESFLFVDRVAYDLLFPRAYAVVHHGGAGTTHLGLTFGCPTMIIPHIVDQFSWDRLVAEREFGPRGLAISKLDRNKIARKLEDLFTNPLYLENARVLGSKLRAENWQAEVCRFITEE